VAPLHLYLSDSTKDARSNTIRGRSVRSCYVNSYRIGFVSVRKRGETWDDLEGRVRTLTRNSFPPGSLVTSSSVQPPWTRTLSAKCKKMLTPRGERIRRARDHDYRSPEQEALLMRTAAAAQHTLTSLQFVRPRDRCEDRERNLANPSTRRSFGLRSAAGSPDFAATIFAYSYT